VLFLLKRTVATALVGLLALVPLGVALRSRLPDAPPLHFIPGLVLLGVAVCGGVLASDGLIHGVLLLVFGEAYQKKHLELAAVFRGQSLPAMLTGALLAGAGEELVFRGLGTSLTYLLPAALLFGLMHHIRWSLTYVTLWSIWEGVLFALVLYVTGELLVTMVAHFLHDLLGFLIFRRLNARAPARSLDNCADNARTAGSGSGARSNARAARPTVHRRGTPTATHSVRGTSYVFSRKMRVKQRPQRLAGAVQARLDGGDAHAEQPRRFLVV
jgi:membrane protease YdiL (CAAX protease family)